MKLIIGLLMVVAGIVLGLYVGLWVCFIGGIVQVIEQLRAEDLVAMKVAIGIAKVVFAGLVGVLSGLVLFLPGSALIKKS